MQKVALYTRVSGEEQSRHGISLLDQIEALRHYARENNYIIAGEYQDPGISARKPYTKRPGLMALLEDAKSKRFDMVLFTKLDRWFRNVGDYYEVQRILDDAGVTWKAVREDYETVTASGRLKVNIMLSVAQDEADRTSERLKSIFATKVSKREPVSGKVPLGYKIEDKKLVIDPSTAPIAQDIFHSYLGGMTISALRRYIIQKYGITYCHTSLKSLLTNTRYIGKAHGYDDFCQPLVSASDFERVSDILKIRAQRNSTLHNHIYLFTGIVFCSECGNRLGSHVVRDKYMYYKCTRYDKLHLCTHSHNTSELVLEKWLLDNLIPQFEAYNMELAQRAAEQPTKVDTSKIRRKMEKLKDLYLNDLIDRSDYERDYTTLKLELEQAAIPEKKMPSPVDIEMISDLLKSYETLSRQGKREFWHRIVSKIVITQNDEFFVTPVSRT